jgi:putative transposase
MPRPPRIFYAGAIHHLTARGNNKMALFRDSHDFRIYRKLWVISKGRFGLKVYRWALMTNHVHFLVEQLHDTGVAEAMHFIQGRYSRYFGRKYHWKGHVWEGRYTSRLILDDRYFGQCARYIENNPVVAKMVQKAEAYPWSSAAFYKRGYRDALTDQDPYSDKEAPPPTDLSPSPDLFIGRRAVGNRDRLRELSHKLGINLLLPTRRTIYRD